MDLMIKSVIKRDGKTVVPFNISKIIVAIEKANEETKLFKKDEKSYLSNNQIESIAQFVSESGEPVSDVKSIQNLIEDQLMFLNKFDVARRYITYRYKRNLIRKSNSTDESIMSLLKDENELVARENSNKKSTINSTKRDLIAGEVSKDLAARILLPRNIVEAHDRGTIHFHDMDYFMMPEFNCCLPNFRDMLHNGTLVHGVAIEKPKSFRVACNVITQSMADIASNQYGGQTFYSDVLGEYLAYTKEKFEKRIRDTVYKWYGHEDMPQEKADELEELISSLVKEELQIELKAGIQCIQYQINSLMTTNGQSPFVTIFMYLRDDDPYIEENAMIIEEILRQRLEGLKNKDGIYTTPPFPKLVYVLTESNCLKGGKYDYLTHLAAKCSAKRMYPDYISEKIMKEQYDGEVFGCMGCVSGDSSIMYSFVDEEDTSIYGKDTFSNIWKRLARKYEVKEQIPGNRDYLYMDITDEKENFKVWDTKKGYVKLQRIIKNKATDWVKVTMKNGLSLKCTYDHPFDTENRGEVQAINLKPDGDIITTFDMEHGLRAHSEIIDRYNEEHKSVLTEEFHQEVALNTLTETEVDSVEKFTLADWSYDVTTESEHFEVNNIYSHNCRSFLGPWKDENGKYKWEGRFNQGVVTLNLPMLALDAKGDEDTFWSLLNDRLAICFDALMCRHKALEGVKSDVSPIHWQDGAISRLKPGEVIDPLLHGNYSSISLGYIGLYECVKYITGESHTEGYGREFSLKVMNALRAATDNWKASTDIGFSLYGTPAESVCYSLCEKIKKVYGDVEGITDKGWLTNSYHVTPTEPIDAFSKLGLESVYQNISSGGCISYVEIPNLNNNVEAVEELIKFIYDNVRYGEFNTRSDYCSECGFDGEIKTNDEGVWQCPKCGCTDIHKLIVVRRTCGYLGTLEAGWNEGKTKEINERVLHLY